MSEAKGKSIDLIAVTTANGGIDVNARAVDCSSGVHEPATWMTLSTTDDGRIALED